ncbi:MAG: hypothetical protein ABW039_08125 [Sphingobium sp.]
MMRNLLCLLILSGILSASPVLAQSSDRSASLDAIATFEDAPMPPIELSVLAALNFGKLAIPNKIKPSTICRYETFFEGSNTLALVNEVNGNTVVSGSQGTAGCSMTGGFFAGGFRLGCQDGMTVRYKITYASAGVRGADFKAPVRRLGAAIPALDDPRRIVFPIDSPTGQFMCVLGLNSKNSFVYIGAVLDVTNEATLPRGTKVNVGTITLDVSY